MENTFFEWWEDFTEMAYSKNLEIIELKDKIRDYWEKHEPTVSDALKLFTR